MGLTIKAGGGGPSPIDAGAWPAVCVGYADLGTQRSDFGGKISERQKVMLFWDIPELRIDVAGESLPRRISGRYSLSLFERSSFRKMLDAWLGKLTREQEAAFDLDNLIGRPCLLNVTHKVKSDGKVFSSVQSVMMLPRGMQRPGLESTPIRYSTLDERGNFVHPTGLPDWIVAIIKESYEYKKAMGDTTPPSTDRSEVEVEEPPF